MVDIHQPRNFFYQEVWLPISGDREILAPRKWLCGFLQHHAESQCHWNYKLVVCTSSQQKDCFKEWLTFLDWGFTHTTLNECTSAYSYSWVVTAVQSVKDTYVSACSLTITLLSSHCNIHSACYMIGLVGTAWFLLHFPTHWQPSHEQRQAWSV